MFLAQHTAKNAWGLQDDSYNIHDILAKHQHHTFNLRISRPETDIHHITTPCNGSLRLEVPTAMV